MNGPSRSLRATRLALPVLALCCGVFVVCAAQEAAPAAPRPIQTSEVAGETERVNTELRRLRSLMASSESVSSARDELDELESTIRELEREYSNLTLAPHDRTKLRTAEGQWLRVDGRLERAEERIGALAQGLDNGIGRLERHHEVWTTTLESASSDGAPQAILDRIVSVADELLAVRVDLEHRLGAVLILQNRITSDRIHVAGALDDVQAAKDALRRRIFRRSSRPLWKLLATDAPEIGLGGHLRNSVRDNVAGLAEFVEDNRDLLVLHGLLTILLVVLLARLRRQASLRVEKDSELDAASRILSRPVSAALVVSLTSTVALYPGAPVVVWEIAYLAAALPLLMLVRAAVPSMARSTLFGLVGLFITMHLLVLLAGHAPLQRSGDLVLSVLALGGLLRLSKRGREESLSRGGLWWRVTLLAGRVSALLLSVAVVANIFGFASLEELLTRGTINSAYLAVTLLATTLILDGAVSVELQTEFARKLRMVRNYPKLIRQRLVGLIRALSVLLWASVTLLLFDLLDSVVDSGQAVLGRKWVIGSIDLTLGSVVAFLLMIWVSIQISRFVRFALDEDIYPRVTLARGLPGTVSMLVRYSILALGFMIAVAAAGIDLSNFAILAGALGVGIGFGLQNVVNNFVSGLILAFERPVQIGDTIEVGELLGEVKKIGIRASTVRTLEGAEVIVPNGDLISVQVTNWTLSDRRRRVRVPVGVAYGTDPEKVIKLLNEVADGHTDVLERPMPAVLFLGFGDSSLDFDLRFWTARFERWRQVRSDVTVAINAALTEAGIVIPFPQRDLHLRSVDGRAARTLDGGAGEQTQGERAAEVDRE